MTKITTPTKDPKIQINSNLETFSLSINIPSIATQKVEVFYTIPTKCNGIYNKLTIKAVHPIAPNTHLQKNTFFSFP